jgi:hypothetical protein
LGVAVTLNTEKLEALIEGAAALEASLSRQLAQAIAEEIGQGWSLQSPSLEGESPAVVTGNLANSIRLEPTSSGSYRVGTSLAYGRGLEFGTRRAGARPWLRPAVERVRQGVRQLVQMIFWQQILGNGDRETLDEILADIAGEGD